MFPASSWDGCVHFNCRTLQAWQSKWHYWEEVPNGSSLELPTVEPQNFVTRTLSFSYRKQNWAWRQMCVEVHRLCSLHQTLSEEVYCKRQHNPWQQDVKVFPHIHRQTTIHFIFTPLILGNNKQSWNTHKQILLRDFLNAQPMPHAHTLSEQPIFAKVLVWLQRSDLCEKSWRGSSPGPGSRATARSSSGFIAWSEPVVNTRSKGVRRALLHWVRYLAGPAVVSSTELRLKG